MSDEEIIPFTCPKCGYELFQKTIAPNKETFFEDSVCPKCGSPVTQDDVERQAKDILDKLVRKAVGSPKKKIIRVGF